MLRKGQVTLWEGNRGEIEASIQIQNYVLSGKNTADPPECNSFGSLCISSKLLYILFNKINLQSFLRQMG